MPINKVVKIFSDIRKKFPEFKLCNNNHAYSIRKNEKMRKTMLASLRPILNKEYMKEFMITFFTITLYYYRIFILMSF